MSRSMQPPANGWEELKAESAMTPKRSAPSIWRSVLRCSAIYQPAEELQAGSRSHTPYHRREADRPRSCNPPSRSTTQIGHVFHEQQIFRIDHYLGKETVQNLMALRFANALYEPLWNSAHIDHVQITVAEAVGLENRAGYYDKAGALRDMVQNHMLQLLCLVAMEPPSSMDADAVRDEKLKVLRSLSPINAKNSEELTVRGQYRAGASAGGAVKGYLEELERHEQHRNIRRHQGRDRQLALGRRAVLSAHRQAAGNTRFGNRRLVQADPALDLRRKSPAASSANQLVIRLQPDEGVKQWMMIKDPGPGGMRLRHVPLDMTLCQILRGRSPDAYERLIMDVVRGNQTLFMRRDEVVAAWTMGRPDPQGLGRKPAAAARLHRRNMGSFGVDRADRARRPHLA